MQPLHFLRPLTLWYQAHRIEKACRHHADTIFRFTIQPLALTAATRKLYIHFYAEIASKLSEGAERALALSSRRVLGVVIGRTPPSSAASSPVASQEAARAARAARRSLPSKSSRLDHACGEKAWECSVVLKTARTVSLASALPGLGTYELRKDLLPV